MHVARQSPAQVGVGSGERIARPGAELRSCAQESHEIARSRPHFVKELLDVPRFLFQSFEPGYGERANRPMFLPMAPPASPYSRIFPWLAPAFVGAALFHGAAFFKPEIAEAVPRWWHAMFVGINVALTVGILKRPRGFIPLYVIYTAQQLYEHLTRGTHIWATEHRLDWASVVSVLFVPAVLVLLILDARSAGYHAPSS